MTRPKKKFKVSGIYPAYAYEDILPRLGFAEIQESEVQQGDICVLSQNSKSGFGHIAIYDGKQWISDFKQKSKYPGTATEQKARLNISVKATDGTQQTSGYGRTKPLNTSSHYLITFIA